MGRRNAERQCVVFVTGNGGKIMAFTNPILAGEQLQRTGIRSDNYLAGVRGWRIASNGAAEFDNLGLRGNLWVPTITLNGRDLGSQLNSMPKGILAWMNGFPVISTTSGAKLISTEVDVVNGRWYEISLINITPDIANVKQAEFHIKYTTNGSDVTMASADLAISLRVSQFEMANVRAMYSANFTGRLKLAGTIHSLDGQTVRSWAPGNGCVLAVYDVGITPTQFGSIGSGTPGKTLKEIYCTGDTIFSYRGDRSIENTSPTLYDKTVQGDFLDGRGIRRTWITFTPSDLALIADIVGIPYTDVDTCELFINTINWANGAGWPQIGYHNSTTLGATEPTGGLPRKQEYFQNNVGGFYMDLKANGSASGSIVESMQSGYFKGFIIGPEIGASGFTDSRYRMIASATEGGPRPQLHVKYYK
jgi:hypothetical protein